VQLPRKVSVLPQVEWHWAYRPVVLVVRPRLAPCQRGRHNSPPAAFRRQSLAGRDPRVPLIERSSRVSSSLGARASMPARGQRGTAGPAALREHGVDGLREFRGPGVAPAERVDGHAAGHCGLDRRGEAARPSRCRSRAIAAAAGIQAGALILAAVAVAAGTGCFPGSREFDCALMPGPRALPGMSTPPVGSLGSGTVRRAELSAAGGGAGAMTARPVRAVPAAAGTRVRLA
jgi:hypothetical protein